MVGTVTARCRGEDNSKMDSTGMGKVGVELFWLWIKTGRRVLVNMLMDYRLHPHQQMHYSKHIMYFTITSFNNIGVSSLNSATAPKHVAAN